MNKGKGISNVTSQQKYPFFCTIKFQNQICHGSKI